MVKTYALIVIPCFGVNCVATEVKLRFSCAASAAHFFIVHRIAKPSVICNLKVAKSTLKLVERDWKSTYHRAIKKRKDISIMLNVSHVTKKYGKVTACDDLSFHLDPGSVTVLLGPNGAGKSTIMKAIIGFLRYDGEITVGGYPNKTTDARRLLGYIPEMPSLYPNLTVSEHMEFIARAYRLSGYQERIEELFRRFELMDKKKKFGDELSKGMQQKLNICLGLLPEPKMLLLDEPMIGLDPHAIKELKLLIEEMRSQGRTMLVSTHIIDSVDMLWDRTIIMDRGAIRANVTREDLDRDGRTLEQLFFDVTEGVSQNDMAHSEAETSEEG